MKIAPLPRALEFTSDEPLNVSRGEYPIPIALQTSLHNPNQVSLASFNEPTLGNKSFDPQEIVSIASKDPTSRSNESPVHTVATVESEQSPTFPIDLPSALRLADADSLLIALTQEQIQESYADYRRANALWLPSLRSGVHWNKHEGQLLSSSGEVRDISRGSLDFGAGAFAVGAGSQAIPGISANFHLADAIFLPLAARQRAKARESAASATRNNVLLDVSLAYLQLLRASQEVAITTDLHEKFQELSRLTDAFATTGQGTQADADRMRVELGMRELEIAKSLEVLTSASARLAEILRLDSCIRLEPTETEVIKLCLVPEECECPSLVVQALSNRPELLQSRFSVGEANEAIRRERFAPRVPNVILGASYGGFGGGTGSDLDAFGDRFDFDATAYWEIRNLGMGEIAARDSACSRLRQARIRELSVRDQVVRETTEAFSQLKLRRKQIGSAETLVGYATESYDSNFLRIKHGQGLPIETLQSANALLQAQREYLRTIVEFNSAQFTLRRALGWPIDNLK